MQLNTQKRNIAAAITEHVVSVLVMFITYRYAIGVLGLKTVGLWSLIIAIFSLSSIGNSGFASSAVKFVSKYLAKNDYASIVKVISTTFLTVLVITVFLIAAIYFSIQIFHGSLFSADEYGMVNEVIFLGGISFSTAIFGRVFLSALDGLQLINYRSYIGIVSKFCYGLLCIILIRPFGLKGLIFAECIQYFIVLIGSIVILWANLKPTVKNLFPDKKIFKEIFAYGTSFQITSIFQMFMDPLTKFFLKNFGGLASVALYDIAYKFFFQARLLIVVVINTLVPYVSILKEKSEFEIKPLFLKVFREISGISLGLILMIFAILPLLFSFMHIGYSSELLRFSFIIAITILINLLALTPFTFNLGTGLLKANLLFTISMAVVNFFLGFLLGIYFGAIGIMIAGLMSQLVALIILLYLSFNHYLITFKVLFNRMLNMSVFFFIGYLSLFYIIHLSLNIGKFEESLLNLITMIPFCILLTKQNEMLKSFKNKVFIVLKSSIHSIFKSQVT